MRRLCRERTVSANLGRKRCTAKRDTALLLRARMQRRDLPLSRSMRGVLSRPPQQSHFRADGGRGVRQVRAEQGRWGIMTNSQEKEVPPRAYARGGTSFSCEFVMIPHLPCSALTCRTPLPPSARKWLCCGGRESTPRIERDKGRSRLCIRARSKRAVSLFAVQRFRPKFAETVLSLQSRRIFPPGRAELTKA